jgi:hypothetical protein
MAAPAKGKVALRALLNAVADTATDVVYYVDSHSGDVLKIARSTPMPELARFKSQADKDPDRFLKVPKATSEEAYGDINAFMASVKDKKLQERLRVSVAGGGTLRNFLDALNPAPIEKERWYKFRDARTQGRIEEWARQSGLGFR